MSDFYNTASESVKLTVTDPTIISIIPARFNRIKTVEHTGKSSEKQNSQQKKEQLNP